MSGSKSAVLAGPHPFRTPAPADDRPALERSLTTPERARQGVVVVEATTDAPGIFNARVQPALERYERRGVISFRQARAGERLYRSFLLMNGVREADGAGTGGHWTPAGYSDAVLSGAKDFREAQQALGRRLWPLVYAVVVEDWRVERYAHLNGRNVQSTTEVLRVALDMLADFFWPDE